MSFVAEIEMANTTVVLLVAEATDATDATNQAWTWMAADNEEPIEATVREATSWDEERLAGLAI